MGSKGLVCTGFRDDGWVMKLLFCVEVFIDDYRVLLVWIFFDVYFERKFRCRKIILEKRTAISFTYLYTLYISFLIFVFNFLLERV